MSWHRKVGLVHVSHSPNSTLIPPHSIYRDKKMTNVAEIVDEKLTEF